MQLGKGKCGTSLFVFVWDLLFFVFFFVCVLSVLSASQGFCGLRVEQFWEPPKQIPLAWANVSLSGKAAFRALNIKNVKYCALAASCL